MPIRYDGASKAAKKRRKPAKPKPEPKWSPPQSSRSDAAQSEPTRPQTQTSRSDAAQNVGANTPRPKVRSPEKTPYDSYSKETKKEQLEGAAKRRSAGVESAWDRKILRIHEKRVARQRARDLIHRLQSKSQVYTDEERETVADYLAKQDKKEKEGKPGKGPGIFQSAAIRALPVVGALGGSPAAQEVVKQTGKQGAAVGLALAKDPGKTVGNTVKDIPNVAQATVAGVADLVMNPTHVTKIPGAVKDDYQRRYKGSIGERADRIAKEGALAEVLDAATVTSGGGAAVGRATTKLAKTGVLGERAARVASAPRPRLRVSAGEAGTKEQELSKNFFRAVAQRQKDKARASTQAKRVTKARSGERPLQGLEAGPGEVVKRSLRAQRKGQRVEVSRDVARGHVRLKTRQQREIHGGIDKERRALSKEGKRAETLALQGLIKFDDAEATRTLLTKYRERIIDNRSGDGLDAQGRKIPKDSDTVRQIDDVLRALDENPDAVLSPELRDYVSKQQQRQARLRDADNVVDDLTADVRRWQPLGRVLGEERKLDTQVAKIEKRLKDGEFGKGEAARAKAARLTEMAQKQFVSRVSKQARELGLPEPVYVLHRPRATAGFADYAAGGTRAVGAPKKSQFKLFDEGRADTSGQSYTQGVARNIKTNVNWNTVADSYERHTPAWGRNKPYEALMRELEERGLDPKEWQAVDLGRLRKARRDEDGVDTESGALADAMDKSTFRLDGDPADFAGTNGLSIVPKGVADELKQLATPAGAGRRFFQKIQGNTSKVLLNMNPSFVPVQIANNLPLSLLATKHHLGDFFRAQRWWNQLDEQSQDAIGEFLGVSPGLDAIQTPRLGAAADNRLVRAYHAFVDSDRIMSLKEKKSINPMQWNPFLDEKQNAYFRKVIFYNSVKQKRRMRINRNAGRYADEIRPVMAVLEMPPGPEKAQAIRRLEPEIEKAADRVNKILGDYTRYTARERKIAKTALLFYGFLRWSVATTLYTLPVKHPLLAVTLANIGRLHKEEQIDLLGGHIAADSKGAYSEKEVEALLRSGKLPYAFGRIYTEKDGKLKESTDFARINPLLNPLVDFAEDPKQGAVGLISPALSSAAKGLEGRDLATDRALTVDGYMPPFGRAAKTSPADVGQVVLRDMLRLMKPVQVADDVRNVGRRVADDQLPIIGQGPKAGGSKAFAERLKRRADEEGSRSEQILDRTVPFRKRPAGSLLDSIKSRVDAEKQDQIERRKAELEGQGKRDTEEYRKLSTALGDVNLRRQGKKRKPKDDGFWGGGEDDKADDFWGTGSAKKSDDDFWGNG